MKTTETNHQINSHLKSHQSNLPRGSPILFAIPNSQQEIEQFHQNIVLTSKFQNRNLWIAIEEFLESGGTYILEQRDFEILISSIFSNLSSSSKISSRIEPFDINIYLVILNLCLSRSNVFLPSHVIPCLYQILPLSFSELCILQSSYCLASILFKYCNIITPDLLMNVISSFFQSYSNYSLSDSYPRTNFFECLVPLSMSISETHLENISNFVLPLLLSKSTLENWSTASLSLTVLKNLIQRFPIIIPQIISSSIFSVLPELAPTQLITFRSFAEMLTVLAGKTTELNLSFVITPELLQPFFPLLEKSMTTLVVAVARLFGVAANNWSHCAEAVLFLLKEMKMDIDGREYIIKVAFVNMIYDTIMKLGLTALAEIWPRYSSTIIDLLDSDSNEVQIHSLEMIKMAFNKQLPMPDNFDYDTIQDLLDSSCDEIKILTHEIIKTQFQNNSI